VARLRAHLQVSVGEFATKVQLLVAVLRDTRVRTPRTCYAHSCAIVRLPDFYSRAPYRMARRSGLIFVYTRVFQAAGVSSIYRNDDNNGPVLISRTGLVMNK
jgi:hypothetical protein